MILVDGDPKMSREPVLFKGKKKNNANDKNYDHALQGWQNQNCSTPNSYYRLLKIEIWSINHSSRFSMKKVLFPAFDNGFLQPVEEQRSCDLNTVVLLRTDPRERTTFQLRTICAMQKVPDYPACD